MTNAIELQVISRILTASEASEVDRLCAYDESYYAVFKEQIHFILEHKSKYGDVPDLFTFQAEYNNITLVDVTESLDYLEAELKKNKQHILFLETFNKLADLNNADVADAWKYLESQCEKAAQLDASNPMDIVKDAEKRADQIVEFNKQNRIPTGFAEVDKLMYGGLSTVEELLVIIARTNTGKSWVCTKMMESAQKHGFPVLYYSPEMRSSFIGTRFDTWRGHFRNSEIFRGQYSEEYKTYLKNLVKEQTGAFVVEDSDISGGRVTVKALENLVKRHHIKLLIVDGLSYIADTEVTDNNSSIKYKNICNDLFRLSKTYGCAVVCAVQANRETRENRDDKGEPFPTMFNAAESDHPARIATQVFALRQLFDSNTLEIRLEKSRIAKNVKPVLSYVWDPNTGSTEFVADSGSSIPASTPQISAPSISSKIPQSTSPEYLDDLDDDDDEDIVF